MHPFPKYQPKSREADTETLPFPLIGYRASTSKDIAWGKTIYQTCRKTPRTITLHRNKIKKLTITTLKPKVGMNAADHDRYIKSENDRIIREMRFIAGNGEYWVEE